LAKKLAIRQPTLFAVNGFFGPKALLKTKKLEKAGKYFHRNRIQLIFRFQNV
jgi:hypothetical protein